MLTLAAVGDVYALTVKVMDAALLEMLGSRVQRDFETRQKLLREDRLFGGYVEEMQRVHRENAVDLAGIVETHGWPGIAAGLAPAARGEYMRSDIASTRDYSN